MPVLSPRIVDVLLADESQEPLSEDDLVRLVASVLAAIALKNSQGDHHEKG